MSTNGEVEFDGDIWFFTDVSSVKIDEIEANPRVNVSFAEPKKQVYISLTGDAEVVSDRSKIEELWRPSLEIWFPKGLNDPNIALIKVNVSYAEYWDGSKNIVSQVVDVAKSYVLGQRPKLGDHEKIPL